jgi:hypothetical protein
MNKNSDGSERAKYDESEVVVLVIMSVVFAVLLYVLLFR